MSDDSDGGLESRRFVFEDHRHVSYGPAPAGDNWTLTFTDDELGRVEIVLDKHAMYELWIEVADVPWPREPRESGRLQREIVHRTRGMDEEMLENVLGYIEEEYGPHGD